MSNNNYISHPYLFNEENVHDIKNYSDNKNAIIDTYDTVEQELIDK